MNFNCFLSHFNRVNTQIRSLIKVLNEFHYQILQISSRIELQNSCEMSHASEILRGFTSLVRARDYPGEDFGLVWFEA